MCGVATAVLKGGDAAARGQAKQQTEVGGRCLGDKAKGGNVYVWTLSTDFTFYIFHYK
jgi:hypothetical protein